MYRLLIVDDEPAIVNGLALLFQEKADFELEVCKAYSAREALEIARKTKLDVVVSDIRMPQKSGLQLMDDIVYYWPSCRIILLTGYSEFDYVYEAIRKNVENYILKTEGIDPIFEAVKRAIDKLEQENRHHMLEEKALMHAQFAEPLLKKEMLEALLLGEPVTLLLANARYAEVEFRIQIEQPAFFIAGQINRLEEQSPAHKSKLLQAVQQTFDTHLPVSIQGEQTIYDANTLVWLLQPHHELIARFTVEDHEVDWQGIVGYMKSILEAVQNDCEENLDVSVSFAVSGNLVDEWDDLHEQVEAARTNILKRFQLGQEMVVLDLGMKAEMMSSQMLLIEQIHHYIQNQLSGDLSLTAIAAEVHFNPSYLSRYYKQITGRNLMEYIQSIKLESAIAMMANPQMKLNEIASKLGFDSPSYFTTFFKKMTGTSPQEFRNLQ
ncbi:helix-turn-helix domain-containing protein [Paenibacillus chondroitinus]|uniref:Helix-turn-helix domain-containing protein n=1 Tax=Paenibacillus chondroitinus TaxID=59842 RepID=A0ABU6DC39_9BACL|nr:MULTISPECIES: helix-turn-helix domain-containing protein [Paenibacillus]MCY9656501.1 helix-turn-helix domain-containing protein [Paenibacillus anseongense]MEB4795325.1 helix-turn-helix domain-containing protein [Paenibacillus chondroitinus]